MMTAQTWELSAALSVLEQAQQYAATLRNETSDLQALDAAERRCCAARRIVERIRATLEGDFINQCTDCAQGDVHG